MSEKIYEQVSALLDEELPSKETAEILSQLREREDLQEQWNRFHLIGDVMRGEALQVNAFDIASRVRTSLKDEPAIIAAPKVKTLLQQGPLWIRTLAGAGLAASVAALAVITAPYFLGSGDALQMASNTPAVSSPYAERPGTRWKNLQEPAVESRLNGYLVEHSEYAASPGGVGGVIPYATFVGYDAKR